jgi:hypothetical protein
MQTIYINPDFDRYEAGGIKGEQRASQLLFRLKNTLRAESYNARFGIAGKKGTIKLYEGLQAEPQGLLYIPLESPVTDYKSIELTVEGNKAASDMTPEITIKERMITLHFDESVQGNLLPVPPVPDVAAIQADDEANAITLKGQFGRTLPLDFNNCPRSIPYIVGVQGENNATRLDLSYPSEFLEEELHLYIHCSLGKAGYYAMLILSDENGKPFIRLPYAVTNQPSSDVQIFAFGADGALIKSKKRTISFENAVQGEIQSPIAPENELGTIIAQLVDAFNSGKLNGANGATYTPTASEGTDAQGNPTVTFTFSASGELPQPITLTLPRGLQGEAGNDGADGKDGTNGAAGENGKGLPTGGTDGQYPRKVGTEDYITEWTDFPPFSTVQDIGAAVAVETMRAKSAESALSNQLAEKVNTSIADSLLYSLTANREDNTSAVILNAGTVTLLDGARGSVQITLPIASADAGGIMPLESFTQIQANSTAIEELKGRTVRLTAHFGGTIPTQEDLIALWTNSGRELTDGATIVDLDSNGVWTYFETLNAWEYRGTDTVALASNTSAGIVQGANTAGKVFVEQDGTMSLVGFDTLEDAINQLDSAIGALSVVVEGKAATSDLANALYIAETAKNEADYAVSKINELQGEMLTAEQISQIVNTAIAQQLQNYVPTSRKIAGQVLTADITLNLASVDLEET